MKGFQLFSALFLTIILGFAPVRAANSNAKNIGFETGTFDGWVGYSWIYRTDASNLSTPKVAGIISGRHTIMSDTSAYDSNTGSKLRKIPKGYHYSARLGNNVVGGLQESLSYTLTVDSTNALLVWKFAVVLQDPLKGHSRIEEPRFKVTLFNQKGDTIPDCANYDVYVSDARIQSFQTYTSGSSTIVWRDWTTVGANLLPYMGQTVTVEFMAADCTHSAHYGYAYFVAETQPLFIAVKYCTGDTYAKLTAPEGFETYKWTDSKGNVIGTSQVYNELKPVEGAKYFCQMTSATGCTVTLNSIITRYEPNADFKYDLVDCNTQTNTMNFTNLHPATHGTLEYKWYFNDGTTSTERNPTHTFQTSGMHPVSLLVSNPPSTCTDSVMKLVETFYPPLIGIVGNPLYCKGSTTTLKGQGAHHYQWSTGSTADSIVVGKDTTVWMIGYSSIGCYTDTIRLAVKQAPESVFTSSGNPVFCAGGSTTLSADGATSYLWSTGATTKSITVKKAGFYSVTGTDAYNCQQTATYNVIEDPLPNVDFTLSSPTVDTKHNKLTCSVPAVDGVNYLWSMGDSLSESGASVTHEYQVSNILYDYKITLLATNANGCVNMATKTVEIVPFIPNVFSPNGDGVNDLFVPELPLQIYDRYGNKLYDGITGWDGTYNGKKMDNDTYFYQITYLDKNKQPQMLKGYVTLKR